MAVFGPQQLVGPSAPPDDLVAVLPPSFLPTANKNPGISKLMPATGDDQNIFSAVPAPTSASALLPNALSSFSSYNYILNLYAASQSVVTTFLQNPVGNFHPNDWKLIISSMGGTGGVTGLSATGAAVKYFSREYYLDNLEFESIVNNTATAAARTVVSLKFNVTESFGINLVQELYQLNTYTLKYTNYLNSVYILEIQWKGYDDQGALVPFKPVKYIPFLMINIEAKLTNAGAEYTIEGVPVNYMASQKKYGDIKDAIHISGKTVKDAILGKNGKTITNPSADFFYTLQQGDTDNLRAKLAGQYTKLILAEGKHNLDDTFSVPVYYDFVFHDEPILSDQHEKMSTPPSIAAAELSTPSSILLKDTQMGAQFDKDTPERQLIEGLKKYSKLAEASTKKIDFTTTSQWNKGNHIMDILNQIIINSTYVTNQIKSFQEDLTLAAAVKNTTERQAAIKSLEKPFWWFRIVPKTYPTPNYSSLENTQQQIIIYHIYPYLCGDARAAGNLLMPSTVPKDEEIVKEYNYFFTGKNTEILSVNLNFNMSYYTYRPSNTQTAGWDGGKAPRNTVTPPKAQGKINPIAAKGQEAAVTSSMAVPFGSAYGTNASTIDRQNANAFATTLFSNVDQLAVEMEIAGDPDLIKQDGVIYDLDMTDNTNMPIKFDGQEQYFKFNVVSPKDINTETGIMDGLSGTDTIYNGIYALISVNSMFKQGKFTQNILMRRVMDTRLSQQTSLTGNQTPVETVSSVMPSQLGN